MKAWKVFLHVEKKYSPYQGMGEDQKDPQNFLTFTFKPFTTLLQDLKTIPSTCPKLLNLNQNNFSKKSALLVKSL